MKWPMPEQGVFSGVAGPVWLAAAGAALVACGPRQDPSKAVCHSSTEYDGARICDISAVATAVRGDSVGTSVSSPGDVDGDGLGDLWVLGSSGAYLIHGPMRRDRHVDRAQATLTAGNQEIYRVSPGGDVDRNGSADLAVLYGGALEVGLLRDDIRGEVTLDDLDYIIPCYGELKDPSALGYPATTTLGDVTGDGGSEVFIPDFDRNDDPTPQVWSFTHVHDPEFYPWDHRYFGTNGVAAGDVNGDGLADLWIASDEAVYLFEPPFEYREHYGPGNYAARIDTCGDGRRASGNAMCSPGDLNGDGHPELVIGSPERCFCSNPYPDYEGHVFLWYGPFDEHESLDSADAELSTPHPLDGTGRTLYAIGDVDSDGRDDLAIGSKKANVQGESDGVLWFFLEHIEGFVHVHEATIGVSAGDSSRFGAHYAGEHDIDGDGIADVLIGAPMHAHDRGDGAVWMLSGVVIAEL